MIRRLLIDTPSLTLGIHEHNADGTFRRTLASGAYDTVADLLDTAWGLGDAYMVDDMRDERGILFDRRSGYHRP